MKIGDALLIKILQFHQVRLAVVAGAVTLRKAWRTYDFLLLPLCALLFIPPLSRSHVSLPLIGLACFHF